MQPAKFEYPALYDTASQLSAASQKLYLSLIRMEYGLLVLAATLALDISSERLFFVSYALVFLALLGILILRSWKKPEQDWYKGRALAESIKTSCWRYCMRAEPFDDLSEPNVRRAEFRNFLKAILEANRHIGESMPPDSAANDQITAGMDLTRALPLQDRKKVYELFRIREQRTWYAKKASGNKRASRRWVVAGGSLYALGRLLVLLRIVYPDPEIWPIEPIIVAAASVVGWTQIKKFNELASSYTLTAHEIGIIQSRIEEVNSDIEFSEFVNDAEQAFSREHTQWVARQQS